MKTNPNSKSGIFNPRVLAGFAFCSAGVFLALVSFAATPAWTTINPGGLTYGLLRAGGSVVYDPTSNEVIMFAGFSEDPTTPVRFNDVWILTGANGTTTGAWTNLIPNGAAGSAPVRNNHSAVYDVANNRMIVYGGCGPATLPPGCLPIADTSSGNFGYVWILTHANGMGGTPTWSRLSPTGATPGPRQGHQAIYDPQSNSMIVWAGQNGGGSACDPDTYSDVWVLSHANGLGGTPNWTQLSPAGGPPKGRYFSTAVYDSTNNIMIVFGGIGMVGTNCTQTNAVWALSNANGTEATTPTWTNLVPQGAAGSPPGRFAHLAVYSTASNTMTVHGGSNAKAPLGDTWILSNANGFGGTATWKQVSPTGTVKPAASARWNGGILDAATNRLIMTGAAGGNSGGSHDGPFWGTWRLDHPNGL